MLRQQVLRFGTPIGVLLLLAGCGATQYRRTELGQRFQHQLAPQLADRQAALQTVPGGVRVIIDDDALFLPGSATLTDHGRYVLAGAIESLLAPPLLNIAISGPPGMPTPLQQARVQAVADFLQDFRLGPALQPASQETRTVAAATPGMPPGVLYMTVTLQPRQG